VILDEQSIPEQIDPVLGQGDAHGHREVARAATKIVRDELRHPKRAASLHRSRTPSSHGRDAVGRIERANQDRRRTALRLGDDIDQRVNAVVEIDVRESRRTIERGVATRWPGGRMARRIRLTDVGFDLNDDTARQRAARAMDEKFSNQVARDVEGWAVVKRPRQLRRYPHLPHPAYLAYPTGLAYLPYPTDPAHLPDQPHLPA